MSSKKKGKVGKKGEKYKEDEAKILDLRRQQLAAAKPELRRRMEEEAKISKMNSLKIVNQWRKIMRLAKAESLKKDIEILSQNHERDVDRKDAILQMLDRDLEEAEDQYQITLRTHLMNVDTLIKLHDTRLFDLEKTFQNQLKILQGEFQKESQMLLAKFQQEKRNLSGIVDAIEKEEEDKENEAKHSFEQLREEIRNRNLEDINMLRISLDAQIEELEQQFETAHLNYLQQTASRTHDFKKLTQNDQKLTTEIDTRKKKIDRLQTTLQQWRAKIRQLTRETEERNRLLKEEKHNIQRHYQQLKQRIQSYRMSQNERLLHLSNAANACKAVLSDKLTIARRILKFGELCRKLETVEEKIAPFTQTSQSAIRGSHVAGPYAEADIDVPVTSTPVASAPMYQSCVCTENGESLAPTERLVNFYRKYNKVLLDSIAIEKHRDQLREENGQLEDLIQQYINGTTVTVDTLANDNPLFVVNGRASLNFAPPVRRAEALTIQDAALIVTTNTHAAARQSRW